MSPIQNRSYRLRLTVQGLKSSRRLLNHAGQSLKPPSSPSLFSGNVTFLTSQLCFQSSNLPESWGGKMVEGRPAEAELKTAEQINADKRKAPARARYREQGYFVCTTTSGLSRLRGARMLLAYEGGASRPATSSCDELPGILLGGSTKPSPPLPKCGMPIVCPIVHGASHGFTAFP